MKKLIKFDSNIAEKILDGAINTAKIVGTTLGPVGSNVIISDNGFTRFTKDGISVLRAVSFEDQYENVAAELIREASDKTNSESGDGTTGTALLAAAIYQNGLKHTAIGANKIHVRNGILKAANFLADYLKTISTPISTRDEIRKIANISSNHSDEIADVLADIFDKIGQNGTIKVETGNTTTIESKIVDGMQFNSGYISPYFVTNEKMEADLDNPFIMIVDKKISNIQEIVKAMAAISKLGRPVLLICDNLEGDALSTVVLNKIRGSIQICAVKCPSYGQNRKNMLQDIAILTGGQVVSEETGIPIDKAMPETGIIGTAKRVIVTRETTTIIGGNGSSEKIAERIEQLKTEIAASKDEYDLKKMRERLAKLDGGVGIISVGAKTESELLEKKDLVDDAFCACKAAIKDGVVAGGGIALLQCKDALMKYVRSDTFSTDKIFSTDELIGARALIDALDIPFKTILMNAGESAELILAKMQEKIQINTTAINTPCYDVLEKEFFDSALEHGLIDPTGVIISEILNSASVAGLLLTTTASIISIPDEKDIAVQNQQLAMQM